jgi:hypothetical protein
VLEGFVQDDLSAALITASQAITHLTSETPAEARRQAVITLQKVINRLDDMAQLIMSSGA